jgi:hypothetical protein
MTELLNSENCYPSRGLNHPRTITVYTHQIYFSALAVKELSINKGDKISFRIKDGCLYMYFDPKLGFNVLEKKNTKQGHITKFIGNTKLCFNIQRFGKKLEIGEFTDKGYKITKLIS